MNLVLDWQKKLGYKKDPFVERPRNRISDFLVDREEERKRLNLFIIKEERFGILYGPKGSGKSTLLAWLGQELRHQPLKVLHLFGQQATSSSALIKQILDEILNPIEKNLTKPHEKVEKEGLEPFLIEKIRRKRRVLLLLDDHHLLDTPSKRLLTNIMETCTNAQLLITAERLLKEYEAYDLRLELKAMEAEALEAMIARRISLEGGTGTHPFTKDELKSLFTKAKRNPQKILSLARERAIELSLKVGPPEKAKRGPEKKVVKVEKKSKGGKFAIKFIDENAEQRENKPTSTKPGIAENEAELLNEITKKIEQNTKKAEEGEPEVEDVLQSLVKELQEENRNS